MPVPSLYENRRAVVQHRTEINNYRSVLEMRMSPAQLAIEIPDDPVTGHVRLSVKDNNGNYNQMANVNELFCYVKKAGDTMTGKLTISGKNHSLFEIKNNNETTFKVFGAESESENGRFCNVWTKGKLFIGGLDSSNKGEQSITPQVTLRYDCNILPNGRSDGCLYFFCIHPGNVNYGYHQWYNTNDAYPSASTIRWINQGAEMVFCSTGLLNVPTLFVGGISDYMGSNERGDIIAVGRIKEGGQWLSSKYALIDHSHWPSNNNNLYVQKSGDTMTGVLTIDIDRGENSSIPEKNGPHLTIKSDTVVYNTTVFCAGRAVHSLNSLSHGYEWNLVSAPNSTHPHVKAMLRFAFCSGIRDGVLKRWPYLWIDTVDANGHTYHYNVYSGENARLGEW